MHRDRHHWFGGISARKSLIYGALVGVAFASLGITAAHGGPFVRLDYNLELESRGRDTAFIELFDDRPLTRDNFLAYVNGNHYDGTIMHRLARSFVVQGGGFYPQVQEEPFPVNVSLNPNAVVDLDGNLQTANPTVMNEFSNMPTRSNVRGTIAMAKVAGDPNSATNQWFVNLVNNASNLDNANGGFTVFAQVQGDGMALFDAMNLLGIGNLNPDVDNNGGRDPGPFGSSASDGVPLLQTLNATNEIVSIPVVLQDAQRIDYFGAGMAILLNGERVFNARDAFFDTGTSITGVGFFRVGPTRTLGVREGFVTGRLIVNDGTIAPGLQLGAATIGSLQQRDTGTLEIQLGGTTADTQYDRLNLLRDAQLAGTLDVSLLGSFTPSPGDAFTVLTAQSITGEFDEIDLPILRVGLVWDVDVSNTAVSLSVAAADYNRNGVVDAADYTLWRDTRGSTVLAAYAGADGDGNGKIEDADYTIWKNNFGNLRGGQIGAGTASLAAAAVPEPSTPWLILAAAYVAAVCMRVPRV